MIEYAKLLGIKTESWNLFEALPDSIVVVNTKGKIVLVNSQAENLFGYSRQEMLGVSLEVLIPESYRDNHRPGQQDYTLMPYTRPMGTRLQCFALRKDGSQVPVEISVSCFAVEEENLSVSALREISWRNESEAQRAVLLAAERDRHPLRCFADAAALALHSAYFHDQNRQLAIEQEHHQLARGLHDSVIQTIFSIKLAAESLLRILDQTEDSNNKMREPIEFVYLLSKNALIKMRELLYHLTANGA